MNNISDKNLIKLLNEYNKLDDRVINGVLLKAIQMKKSFNLINSLIGENQSFRPYNNVINASIECCSDVNTVNLLVRNINNFDCNDLVIIKAFNNRCNRDVIELLMQKYEKVVDEVIRTAIFNKYPEELLGELLKKNNNISNETIAKSMYLSNEFISLLLDKCSAVRLQTVLDTIRQLKSDELIRKLFDKCRNVDSDELIKAIEFKSENSCLLSDERMMRMIDLCPDIHCAVLDAGLKLSDKLVSLLLSKCNEVKVQTVLDAIRLSKSDELIERVINKCIRINSSELIQAINSTLLADNQIERFINQNCNSISETVVCHALENNLSNSLLTLLISRCQVFNVETIRMSIKANKTRDVILLLLKKCKHKNNTDKDGNNLLVDIINYNRFDLTEEFINAGIDVNHRNSIGNSPIVYAINQQERVFIRLLIIKGADVNIKNNFGESPRNIAERIGLNLDDLVIKMP